MDEVRRCSPIKFDIEPARSEVRDGWQVILEYISQGTGPFLVDLSHQPRWDLQDKNLERFADTGLPITAEPNAVSRSGGLLVSRLNRTQCQVWDLVGATPQFPEDAMITEITDGQALLALIGADLEPVMEPLTSLDLFKPGAATPRVLQGSVLKIPSQVIRLADAGDLQAVLIGFPRGYGQVMADAMLDSGAVWGLAPAGENTFNAFWAEEA